MKKLIIILLFSTSAFGQPCDGNNGNNQGTGNNGNGNGNNPCNPAPMAAWPLFGLVVIGSLGYTYWKYKKLENV